MKKFIHYSLVFLCLACLGALAATWQYMAMEDFYIKEEVAVEEGPTIEEEFAALLDVFLSDVARKATNYKVERKVLSDLVKPQNLRQPSYVEENYKIVQILVPDLQVKMDEVIGVFEKTDDEVKALVSDQPDDKKQDIMARWDALKTEEAKRYIGFFEFEEQILEKHEELMALYYDTHGRFTVDIANDRIVFDVLEDELKAQELKVQLANLKRQQGRVLAEGRQEKGTDAE